MSTDEKERKKVRLVPGNLRLMQKTSMAIFRLTHWELVYRNQEIPEEGIHLVITMKRKLTTEMMTTYLPTTLLLLIAYSTTFFKPCFFEAALSVNLTTMLVMTTIFISKMESLPATSYMKMIDIWLILCQLAPFAQVVLITAMEYLRKDEFENERKEGVVSCIKTQEELPNVEDKLQDAGVVKVSRGSQNHQQRKYKMFTMSGLQFIGEFLSLKCGSHSERFKSYIVLYFQGEC